MRYRGFKINLAPKPREGNKIHIQRSCPLSDFIIFRGNFCKSHLVEGANEVAFTVSSQKLKHQKLCYCVKSLYNRVRKTHKNWDNIFLCLWNICFSTNIFFCQIFLSLTQIKRQLEDHNKLILCSLCKSNVRNSFPSKRCSHPLGDEVHLVNERWTHKDSEGTISAAAYDVQGWTLFYVNLMHGLQADRYLVKRPILTHRFQSS